MSKLRAILPKLSPIKVLAVALLGLLAALVFLLSYSYGSRPGGEQVGIDAVLRLADDGRIVRAQLLDQDAEVSGKACSIPVEEREPGGPLDRRFEGRCAGTTTSFHAPYPTSGVSSQGLLERIGERAPVTVDHQTSKAVAKLLATVLLPLLILATIFALVFLARSGAGGVSEIVDFGKLKGRGRARATSNITFADVAGADEVVTELREVIDYLKDPTRFEAFGAAAPKGVLLFGPPGCGKTLVARAVAGESQVPFLSISGTEFVESLVGVGAARVRDLFAHVREIAPAIVFIDEIDAVGRRREGEGNSGGEREQTLNQLLVELDGFEAATGIVVMGATNRLDILDPALVRPGRFDRHVTLEPPDVVGREEILRIHARNKPLAPDVDLTSIARGTAGFTGADLANVVNEGVLLAMRAGNGAQVGSQQLHEAIQRVLHGPRRRGRIMSAEEQRRLAFHEAGHAVVGASLDKANPPSRVSVVARSRGLGRSIFDDGSDRSLFSATDLEILLAGILGGVAAEVLVFGESSTAGAHDIERATEVSQEMVGRYGLSPKVGRRNVLGATTPSASDVDAISDSTLAEFDAEIARLLGAAEARATKALVANRAHLDTLAGRLQTDETLEGAALIELLAPVLSLNGSAPKAPRPRTTRGAAAGPPA